MCVFISHTRLTIFVEAFAGRHANCIRTQYIAYKYDMLPYDTHETHVHRTIVPREKVKKNNVFTDTTDQTLIQMHTVHQNTRPEACVYPSLSASPALFIDISRIAVMASAIYLCAGELRSKEHIEYYIPNISSTSECMVLYGVLIVWLVCHTHRHNTHTLERPSTQDITLCVGK